MSTYLEGVSEDFLSCRSLGLSLLECVTGRYPFDAAAGPLVLMMQVCLRCRVKRCLYSAVAFAMRLTLPLHDEAMAKLNTFLTEI